MQQTFIILISLITILSLFILPNFILNNIEINASIFQQNEHSKMKDNMGDTKLINIQETDIVPDIRDFHDILSIDINKINDNNSNNYNNNNNNNNSLIIIIVAFETPG